MFRARDIALGAWELFFPPSCLLCGAPAPEDQPLCTACAADIELSLQGEAGIPPSIPHSIDRVYTVGTYSGVLRSAIVQAKFKPQPNVCRFLGRLLAEAVVADEVDTVVPVPLSFARLWRRGFNQAALIARPVAAAHGLPLASLALARRHSSPQSRQSAAVRRRAPAESFRVRRPRIVRGRRILLVDDVLTSGATAAACAGALLDAGALRVVLAAVAHTPLKAPGSAIGATAQDTPSV